MAMRKILVDETNRELCEHGTVGFPMTVNHDDSEREARAGKGGYAYVLQKLRAGNR